MVSVIKGIREVHDTSRIRTVPESGKMAEFMHDLFHQAVDKVRARKPMAGHESRPAASVGESKYEVHAMNEDIVLYHSEIESVVHTTGSNGCDDLMRMVLVPQCVICVFRYFETFGAVDFLFKFFFNDVPYARKKIDTILLVHINHYFSLSFFMNGVKRSMGTGNMMVEFFSVATSLRVCKNRSWIPVGVSLMILAASLSFADA